MKTLTPHFHSISRHTNLFNPTLSIPINATSHLKHPKNSPSSPVTLKISTTLPRQSTTCDTEKPHLLQTSPKLQEFSKNVSAITSSNGCSRLVIFGAVSIGLALFLMGIDDQKALALGPEGPLMEEFWDNMRRYALYALTVSTGFAYTVFQPILELLKNPISAVLIITIIGGSIYIVSQVLSAMVGVSGFTYDYSY